MKDELKTLNDMIENIEPLGDVVNPRILKKELIKWIKKIRLAKAWRSYQLRDSDDVTYRNKPPKPKEEMDEKEINSLVQFGLLHDDKPCDFIKHILNISEKDLE